MSTGDLSTALAVLSAVELPYTHMKENAPHKEWLYQEVWLCWGKCVTFRVDLEVSCDQAKSYVTQFLLLVNQNAELSGPSLAPYLPACCLASLYDDNGINL